MAAVSKLTGISDRTALLLICWSGSFISVALAHQLWGGWVAGFFAVLNGDWIARSFLGGSEPLFVALLFMMFLALRCDRWMLATVLASLGTVVRPLGFFALISIGLTLMWRGKFRKLILATLIGLIIGGLYVLPHVLYFGDPLASVHRYWSMDEVEDSLFGFPFCAIIKGTILYPGGWGGLVESYGWILFVLAGIIAMAVTKDFHQYARNHPVEIIFGAMYLLFSLLVQLAPLGTDKFSSLCYPHNSSCTFGTKTMDTQRSALTVGGWTYFANTGSHGAGKTTGSSKTIHLAFKGQDIKKIDLNSRLGVK